MTKITCWIVATAASIVLPTTAMAAELKVFSTIAVEAAMKELAPIYEKQSGNKLDITFGTRRPSPSAFRTTKKPMLSS